MPKLSMRAWISIGTLILMAVIVFFARHELVRAWELMGTVDVWVLFLLIPVIMAGYLATGEMVFSYLRQKGLAGHISIFTQMRISLELNFVNHVLPSGGVSGISYMNWRLHKLGVSAGKATMAQAVRYVAGFAALVSLLVVSVLAVTVDGSVNRWIILMSSTLVTFMIVVTMLCMYVLGNQARMHRIAGKIARFLNIVVKKVSFGRLPSVIKKDTMVTFLDDMHDDYVSMMKDKRVLLQPYLWGIFFTVMEVAIFWIVFWALGAPTNPAPILIGYGLASIAGFLFATPGGTGAYEAVMVFVLAIAGTQNSTAIAGIVLARVIVLFVTVVVGWIFYQQAILQYGKRPNA